jgi:hypothetical protein
VTGEAQGTSSPAPTPPAASPAANSPAPPSPPPPAYPAPPGYYPPPGGYYPPQSYPPPGYPPAPGYYPPPGSYPPPGGYYATPVYAPPPGYHTHDGFYMRFAFGVGGLTASDSIGGRKETYSGVTWSFSSAFGGVVAQNLILYGELQMSVVQDPSYEADGLPKRTQTGYDLNLFSIGPGVAYYLEPMGLHFAGTLTFSQLTYNERGGSSSSESSNDLTDMGVGIKALFGKEWWVSTNWGLGVAGQLHVASMKLKDLDARVTAAEVSLLGTATFN